VGAAVIRVVIADDHMLVRKGIVNLLHLTEDVKVVGEASDGVEALRLLEELRPDVALFDVRMPKLDGIAALEKAKAKNIAPPTILLTTFDDDDALARGMQVGIAGFLLKDVSLEVLAKAIRDVASGKTLIQPAVTETARTAVQKAALDFDDSEVPTDPLTDREREVLRLIAAGMNNREIADALDVAEGTVKNHTSSILSKLGVRDRTRAVLKALRRGDI
jgi:DNA-binding NarL/FixJ family response regulator